MKQTKQTLALLLALLLSLTACGVGSRPREVHHVDWIMSPAYTAEDVALPVPTGDLKGCCTDGEYMYILTDEKKEDHVRAILSRVSLADGTAEVLEQYEPPQPPEGAYTNQLGPILGPDGSLWVYEAHTIMYFDFPEDYDPDREVRTKYYTGQDDFHHLRQLDPATGKQKRILDLSEAVRTLDIESISDVGGFAVDGKGSAYLAGTGGVAVIDSKGKHLVTLETGVPAMPGFSTSGGNLALLPDGTVAALTSIPGGREVRTIDPDARGWGAERYALPTGVELVYDGAGGFLFFYTQGGELYAWEPESEEPRRLLSWSGTDLEGSVMCFAPLDGGKLAALTLRYTDALTGPDSWYNGQLRLSLLTPSDKDPDGGKVRLVYGTMFARSDERDWINRFNKANDRYVIELRDYAGENSDLDSLEPGGYWAAVDAATQLLRAEIAAGNAPDIWNPALDQTGAYARNGYLEDLWPWIDGDAELGGRDALMAHALECMSIDGKLYEVFAAFSIETMAARSDVVGDRMGWTLEELMDCWRQMPEGASILAPSRSGYEMLHYLICYESDRWVDWSTGECSFDSREFKDILELCLQVERDYDPDCDWGTENIYTDLQNRQYLMTSAHLSSPTDLLYYDALCGGPEHLWDYEAYLEENHIYSSSFDDEGNLRGGSVITCSELYFAEEARKTGTYFSWPVAADAAFGALEGGGCAAYVGSPGPAGTNSHVSPNKRFGAAMSSSCKHKEGAWAFIRQGLLPDSADGILGFPINKEAFDKCFEPNWFTDRSGEILLDANGDPVEAPQLSLGLMPIPQTQGDVPVAMMVYELSLNDIQRETFWELYESIRPAQYISNDLMTIIREQAEIYFAGDKSLDETVDLIQRRASLYVNENR